MWVLYQNSFLNHLFFWYFILFILAAPRLSCSRRDLSCSMWTLSCGMHGDLVTPPGVKPGPPALGSQSLTHWTTREVPTSNFLIEKKVIKNAFMRAGVKKKRFSLVPTSISFSCGLQAPCSHLGKVPRSRGCMKGPFHPSTGQALSPWSPCGAGPGARAPPRAVFGAETRPRAQQGLPAAPPSRPSAPDRAAAGSRAPAPGSRFPGSRAARQRRRVERGEGSDLGPPAGRRWLRRGSAPRPTRAVSAAPRPWPTAPAACWRAWTSWSSGARAGPPSLRRARGDREQGARGQRGAAGGGAGQPQAPRRAALGRRVPSQERPCSGSAAPHAPASTLLRGSRPERRERENREGKVTGTLLDMGL